MYILARRMSDSMKPLLKDNDHPQADFHSPLRDKGGPTLGSQGFTTVLAAIWTVILTSFAVVIAASVNYDLRKLLAKAGDLK